MEDQLHCEIGGFTLSSLTRELCIFWRESAGHTKESTSLWWGKRFVSENRASTTFKESEWRSLRKPENDLVVFSTDFQRRICCWCLRPCLKFYGIFVERHRHEQDQGQLRQGQQWSEFDYCVSWIDVQSISDEVVQVCSDEVVQVDCTAIRASQQSSELWYKSHAAWVWRLVQSHYHHSKEELNEMGYVLGHDQLNEWGMSSDMIAD